MNELLAWRDLEQCAAQMAALALAHDWDRLVVLDADFHRQLEQIRGARSAALNLVDAQEKTRLITAVLGHQHTVREQVEPWLAHVQPLLAALTPKSAPATAAPASAT